MVWNFSFYSILALVYLPENYVWSTHYMLDTTSGAGTSHISGQIQSKISGADILWQEGDNKQGNPW